MTSIGPIESYIPCVWHKNMQKVRYRFQYGEILGSWNLTTLMCIYRQSFFYKFRLFNSLDNLAVLQIPPYYWNGKSKPKLALIPYITKCKSIKRIFIKYILFFHHAKFTSIFVLHKPGKSFLLTGAWVHCSALFVMDRFSELSCFA